MDVRYATGSLTQLSGCAVGPTQNSERLEGNAVAAFRSAYTVYQKTPIIFQIASKSADKQISITCSLLQSVVKHRLQFMTSVKIWQLFSHGNQDRSNSLSNHVTNMSSYNSDELKFVRF